MLTFKEYLLEAFGKYFTLEKFWVSPQGEMFDVTHTDHEGWALENIFDPDAVDELYNKYPEYGVEDHSDSEEGRMQIWNKAYELGWVDIHLENDVLHIRRPWGEVSSKAKGELKNFAIEHGLDIVQYHWDKPRIIFSGKE